MKQYTVEGGIDHVRLGDQVLEIEKNFRLYFTTKLANPKFLPEVFIRVSIVNFTVTEDGLEEQLLAELIGKIMPEIETKRTFLIVSIAEGENELRKNEDRILDLLSNSTGNILENDDLISNLESSKQTSEAVKKQLVENETA